MCIYVVAFIVISPLVLVHFRHDPKMEETMKFLCKVFPNVAEYFVKSYLDKIQPVVFYGERFKRSVNKLLLCRYLKYS